MDELVAGISPRPGISHVVFDFDGTISWLRHGWPELMAGLFLEQIPTLSEGRVSRVPISAAEQGSSPSPPGEGEQSGPQLANELRLCSALEQTIHDQIVDDILSLNGKSSIYQMERCAQRVAEHGGPELEPERMLRQYLGVLAKLVDERKEKVRRGAARPDEFVVHGARDLLQRLHGRGLVLVILSGTAEEQVKEEAELLGLAPFFGPHIYGSTADLMGSSKQAVIERLMREEQLSGERLLSFGDGPVEIRLTKQTGGLAVGVASDEDHNGSGKLHAQKAAQLREAGADCLIADYRNPGRLIKTLFGS
ncbi:MAG TPA: HAD family hydrolase [Verrucomicrobiae bacterium]|nr:HAD family hydrolase [Verrucomicrobiae bacterium]